MTACATPGPARPGPQVLGIPDGGSVFALAFAPQAGGDGGGGGVVAAAESGGRVCVWRLGGGLGRPRDGERELAAHWAGADGE